MMLRVQDRERENGFTLIELLVVILIIGILASIAVPTYLRQKQRASDSSVESFITKVVADEARNWVSENPSSWTGPYKSDISGFVNTSSDIQWNIIPSATKTTTGGVDSYSDTKWCIVAYSTKGYKYSASTPLRYDSKRGGLVTTTDPAGACTSTNAATFNTTDTTPDATQLTWRANNVVIDSDNATLNKDDTPSYGLNVTFSKGTSTADYTEWYMQASGVTGTLKVDFKTVSDASSSTVTESTTCRDTPSSSGTDSYYYYDGKTSAGAAVSGETATNVIRVCHGSIVVVASDGTNVKDYIGLNS